MQSKGMFGMTANHEDNQYGRINPEFIGIGKELNRTHIKRKNVQLVEKYKLNRVNFLEKQQISAEKAYEQKQRDLQKLMSVIARKQAEQDQRETMRRQREQKIAELKQQNIRKRNQHQQKLRNAFLNLYDEHHQNYESMKKTLNKHDNLRKSLRYESLQQNREKATSVSINIEEGRKRVESFHKTRNDVFTNAYRQKIRKQNQETERASSQIQNLQSKESELKVKLQRSSERLGEIDDMMVQSRLRQRINPLNNSFTRSFYMKDFRTIDTKDSLKETDLKLEKFIQKELSLNEKQLNCF